MTTNKKLHIIELQARLPVAPCVFGETTRTRGPNYKANQRMVYVVAVDLWRTTRTMETELQANHKMVYVVGVDFKIIIAVR